MTFLNPLLLFGLAAAALPVLIHLLNLRRLNTIEFSSLRFLKELQQTRIRRLKIRQILLLVVRTLLVVFLVLTFSRPALEGNLAGVIGTNARSTMVILLDDSPSMMVRSERGVLFHRAIEAVRQIVKLARPGDEVYYLPLSEVRHSSGNLPASSPESIEESLLKAQPSHTTVPVIEAAARISTTLTESPNINKEVYFVSDAQASQFSRKQADTTSLFAGDVRGFLVQIPTPANPQNLGISSVSARAQVITPERPVSYDVLVQNGGTIPAENTVMSLYLDGIRTVQQSVNLPEESSASFSLNIVPRKTGILRGTVELEEDLFELDNRRYFSFEVPSKIRVAMVGAVEDTRFLELALSAAEGLSTNGLFATTRLDETALGSANLASFDILLLSNITNLTPQEGERLGRFVTEGGGVAFFPGPKTDLANVSTTLMNRWHGPMLTGIKALTTSPGDGEESEGRVTFSRVDLAHPLFAGLFEERIGGRDEKQEIESPLIVTHVQMTRSPKGNTIIELNDGSPFLVEQTVGAGRLLVFAVDPGLAWSDFARKGIFAPLIHRSAVYLTTGREEQPETIVGQPATIILRLPAAPGSTYSMQTPDGIRERVNAELNPLTGMTAFTSPPTRQAGFYELSLDGGDGAVLGLNAVNIDPAESILRPGDEPMIDEFFTSLGIKESRLTYIRNPDEVERTVVESRFGVELWKFMIGAAMFLALCEMAIARVGKKEALTAVEAN